MKRLFCFAAVLLGCLAARAADPSEDDKNMQGAWTPTKAELGGQSMPAAVLKAIGLKIDQGKYEVTVSGEDKVDRGTYLLDTTSSPKGLTITGTDGPNVGKTFPCIYELEGDTLRVCYDLSGTKRPPEFKTSKGTQHYLVTYQRKK